MLTVQLIAKEDDSLQLQYVVSAYAIRDPPNFVIT